MATPLDSRTGLPVVAMVGGGQLSRMTHQAAIALGQSLRVLATDPSESAALVVADVHIGDHRDLAGAAAARRGRHGRDLRPRARADRAPPRPWWRPVTASRRDRRRSSTRRTSSCCAGRSPRPGNRSRPGRRRRGSRTSRRSPRRTAGPSSSRPRGAGTTAGASSSSTGPGEAADLLQRARDPAGRAAGRHAARARGPGGALAVRSGRRLAGRGDGAARRRLQRGARAGPGLSDELATAAQELAVRIADRLGVVGHARRRAVRDRGRRPRQRTRHAAAQLRPLDDRGLPDQPVRAAPARRPGLSARRDRHDRAGRRHGQRARRRRRGGGLGRAPARRADAPPHGALARRQGALVRQGSASRPQARARDRARGRPGRGARPGGRRRALPGRRRRRRARSPSPHEHPGVRHE